MALSRWHSSRWYAWAGHDARLNLPTFNLWHVADADAGLPAQTFYRQQVRKMLASGDCSAVRRCDDEARWLMRRWLEGG